MDIELNNLRQKNRTKSKKRIGRGGKKGTTSGRGTKGQKSRAGHKIRPAERDLIKKIPKLRGYRFKSFQIKDAPVNIGDLEKAFASGDTVNPKTLIEKGLVAKRGGIIPVVKILGTGKLTKKLTIQGCATSASAKMQIEKQKGEVITEKK